MSEFFFRVEKTERGSLARAGGIKTPHGVVETPAFIAVGTQATVKALTPEQLRDLGASCVLANTYHLYLEPGEGVVREAGGIGKFMHYDGPTLTDSGGFQVFSLGAAFGRHVSKINPSPSSKNPQSRPSSYSNVLENTRITMGDESTPLAKIDEEGVTFRSHRDGSSHRFTPERSIEIQHALGADIIFAFDECTTPDAPYAYQKEAMERTHRWALRCLKRHRELQVESGKLKGETKSSQGLFGIVQGGRFEDLRRESARVIGGMEFDGFGIGGSFDKSDMGNAVRWVNEILPSEKPRHLLGIGEPADLLTAIENGCDTFDCVAPTRMGRTGSFYTKTGRMNTQNARFVKDFSPIENDCDCYTCRFFTRAYLHHLFAAREMLAATLASIHNLRFLIRLVSDSRKAILESRFQGFKSQFSRQGLTLP